MKGTCEVKRCRSETELIYYGYDVCLHHWQRHCNSSPFSLKRAFGITTKPAVRKKVVRKKAVVKPTVQLGDAIDLI